MRHAKCATRSYSEHARMPNVRLDTGILELPALVRTTAHGGEDGTTATCRLVAENKLGDFSS